jgi:hypothetical protein
MRVIMRLEGDWEDRVAESLRSWRLEHDSYYGTPHGASFVWAKFRFGGDLVLLSLGVAPQNGKFACGYHGLRGRGGLWMTSGGNWSAYIKNDSNWYWVASGRRHGIPDCPFYGDKYSLTEIGQVKGDVQYILDADGQVVAEIISYETLCPTALPWATDLVAESEYRSWE